MREGGREEESSPIQKRTVTSHSGTAHASPQSADTMYHEKKGSQHRRNADTMMPRVLAAWGGRTTLG